MEISSILAAGPIFLASLMGSPHCVAMCGGFVTIYAHNSRGKILPHLLYTIGRLLTYTILGLIAAGLGASFNSFLPIGIVQNTSAFVVGVSLIAIGLLELTWGRISIGSTLLHSIASPVQKISAPIFKNPSRLTPLFIGFVTTWLPCGWLYTFVALAFAAASPLESTILMLFFWLGTLPAMIAFGAVARVISGKLAQYMPRITALLLIVSGIISLTAHLGHHHHHTGEHHPSPHNNDHAHHHR